MSTQDRNCTSIYHSINFIMDKKLRVLGVCGAQGALLHPIKKYLIGNVEPRSVFWTPKNEQWVSNFGDIPLLRSIEDLGEKTSSHIDVILGSPSCGHSSVFSYSRKKTLGKPREDKCLSLFLSSVKQFSPKIFILENLPKLMDLIPLPEWEENLPNYRLIVHCHSVFAFGNSQKSRKRLLLVGIRKDVSPKIDKIFSKVYSVREEPQFKVKDIKKMIRKRLNYRDADNRKMSMYKYWDESKTTLTVKEIRELWTGKFKDEYKWPMRTQKMKTLPGVYRNRENAYPLTVRPSSRQFNPEGNPVGLEEFRVIIGFPETFNVYFDKENPTYWLNKGRNTLTKGAVYEVGIWVMKNLRKAKKYL